MRYRLAILTNIIAPYRIPIYKELAKTFEVKIFISGYESNRSTWKNLESSLSESGIIIEKVWGITIPLFAKKDKKYFDLKYLHIHPGYFTSLLRYKPDIVISIEMGFRSLMAIIYGKIFRKPVWVWWGGTLHTERSISLVKKLWRKIFIRLVNRWISYGISSTEYLLSLGVKRECILQIQNCVDESLFLKSVPPIFNFYPKPVLLFVGQMIGRKGIDLLLESVARVQQSGYLFTLVLVGEGPEKPRLEKKAQLLGLQNIYFLPPQKPEVMPSIYRSADVLIFPTLEDVWGLVVNEALWSGIPVVCSIYAGCCAEIVPEENRFDPLDPNGFDEILKRAIEGKIAPPDVSHLLSYKEVSQMIINDILQVLNKN